MICKKRTENTRSSFYICRGIQAVKTPFFRQNQEQTVTDNNTKILKSQMKKFILSLVLFSVSLATYAQNDIITKHNGEKIEGNVVRVDEFTITFKYANEDAENVISKYAVASVKHGKSGREENITQKIEINSPKEADKVIILEDNSYTAGLTRAGEIRGKTSFINMRSFSGGDKKAMEKLKKEAAEMGCQFVLITSEKSAVGSSSNQLGGTQSVKTGIAYKY